MGRGKCDETRALAKATGGSRLTASPCLWRAECNPQVRELAEALKERRGAVQSEAADAANQAKLRNCTKAFLLAEQQACEQEMVEALRRGAEEYARLAETERAVARRFRERSFDRAHWEWMGTIFDLASAKARLEAERMVAKLPSDVFELLQSPLRACERQVERAEGLLIDAALHRRSVFLGELESTGICPDQAHILAVAMDESFGDIRSRLDD